MGSQNFFGSYAAIRFATGKKAPGIVWPLLKALGLLVYAACMLPVILIRFLLSIHLEPPAPAPRPTTHRGYPARFADHITDLEEAMDD
jgi:hypothetical protein